MPRAISCSVKPSGPADEGWQIVTLGRGNVNPAEDERKIPLRAQLSVRSQCEDSLALAADSAYDEATDRQPRTRETSQPLDEPQK
jgi:hypothetical protein